MDGNRNGKLLGTNAGLAFRQRLRSGKILPLIGVYDVFSALVAARRFEGVFCSGFSFAASAYGLPDLGFVNWRDMMDFATRVRHALPWTHVLADVDDGFGDEVVAANTVRSLENNGLSCVMMEDQRRPRRCGHFEGKEVLPVEEYLVKLRNVLKNRESIFVIARTDAADPEEGLRRAVAYRQAGADGVMVEAIRDLEIAHRLSREVDCPVMVNQLHGGKSPDWSLAEMQEAGVSIVIYSAPCLFAAQWGIERYLDRMIEEGRLPADGTADMKTCTGVLNAFLDPR
jgi:2-methylisocitrate lyase-like PEP mutase family enzyme